MALGKKLLQLLLASHRCIQWILQLGMWMADPTIDDNQVATEVGGEGKSMVTIMDAK